MSYIKSEQHIVDKSLSIRFNFNYHKNRKQLFSFGCLDQKNSRSKLKIRASGALHNHSSIFYSLSAPPKG